MPVTLPPNDAPGPCGARRARAGTRVAVIGGGLAGTAAAAALVARGRAVSLYASAVEPAASAIPGALLRPHIAAYSDPLSTVRGRGLDITRAWLGALERNGHDAGQCAQGIVIVAASERERRRRDRLPAAGCGPRRMRAAEATEVAGVDPGEDVIFDERGACIRPVRLITALRGACGDRLACVTGHVRSLEAGRAWRLRLNNGESRLHRQVVVAGGAATPGLLPELAGLLIPARGQATAVAATQASARQRLAISGGGYLTPAIDGCHWSGATLDAGDTDLAPRMDDDAENRARFVRWWGDAPRARVVDRFVGLRATTTDRLPVVDEIRAGLWVSAGHGAHGLCTAPLAGSLIAHALTGRRHPLLSRMGLDRPAMGRLRTRRA